MNRRKNDILLKSAFEESFVDLLRFFFADADAIFDMARGFEFMDKELSELFPELEKQGGSRFVDMLAKVYAKDGTEECMLVHLEIQDQHNRQFSKRMFHYFYRIYDRYDVPVTALAVFTGGQPQPASSNQFNYAFLGTKIVYDFNTYHILQHTEQELLAMDNPFALIVLAAQKALLMDKIPEQELSDQRLTIAKALIQSKRYDSEQIRRFLLFLKTFIYIENPEINIKFDGEIDLLTGSQSVMGIIEAVKYVTREEGVEEGREEGRKEGREEALEENRSEIIRNLLKNTDFDITKIASLAGVEKTFVLKIKDNLNNIR